METNKSIGFWLFFSGIVIGIVLSIAVVTGMLSYATGLTPDEIFIKGFLKTKQIEEIQPEKTIKIETGNYLDPVAVVAEKLQKSTVNIRVEKIQKFNDLFFGPFYERIAGVGTGVIIRPDGYILTNYHVVEGADTIIVTMLGGKEYSGKVVGRDFETDIAVVKVDAKNLPAADIGDATKLKVGELAVAVGNPHGLSYTVSAGVISALKRNVRVQEPGTRGRTLSGMIQTDAAINPGNSGGPLANSKGEVVGINTVIYSTTGGSQGIGFAIPINDAMNVAEQLIKEGKVIHPYIGIYGVDVADVSERLPDAPKKGAFVLQVVEGGPAQKAGIKRGDVIIAVNGKIVDGMDQLVAEIRKNKVGEKVKVKVNREGNELEFEVELAAKPVSMNLQAPSTVNFA